MTNNTTEQKDKGQDLRQSNQTVPEPRRCAFCYPSEHDKHGEVRREWSIEWTMFIPVCRKHAQELKDVNENLLALKPKQEGE